jgi:hypothetical protein
MNNNLSTRADNAGHPASALNMLAGIWLIISAWILGFAGLPVPLWNTLLVGIAVLVLAAIRLGVPATSGLSWITFLVGIWLIISPYVLGFTAASAAMTNAIVLGILVGIFSLWAALASRPSVSPSR